MRGYAGLVQRRRVWIAGLAALVLASLVGAAIATNGRSNVARKVTLAGTNIARLSRTDVRHKVEALDSNLRGAKIKVSAPKNSFTITLEELGGRIDIDKTVESALNVGHSGNPIGRLWSGFKSLFVKRPAHIEVDVDPGKVREAVTKHDPGPASAVKEPSLSLKDGVFVAVRGERGTGIDPDDVADALPDAIRRGLPLRISVPRGSVPPQYSLTDAEALARQANKLGKLSLRVTAADKTETIESGMLATWIDALPTPEALLLGVSGARAEKDLAKLFAGVGASVVQTKYGINSEGQVVVTPGQTGTACCDAPQVETLLTQAIRNPPTRPVVLPLRTTEPAITAADVAAFGIKEVIGTFTTRHPCCAPRVSNIHRIADMVRGQVIRPKSRLSINGHVGPRTTAKGFVVDHVIEDGKFAEAVGGGISQFATTTFNAAFFAGLDVPEYQSHGIYISRYPYGREATLNYPHPDLILANNTPYGVLVWPTYTGTTLTVTLYSTKYATGTQTGQTQGKRGVCTVVSTERTRTYPDGTKKTDKFRATYRPQEGINCDGSGTPVTTTTRPKSTTTTGAAPTTAAPPPPTTTTTTM